MVKFIRRSLYLSLCCFGLWGCSAHKPSHPSPKVVPQELPPLPKPETGPETTQASPELYNDVFDPDVAARQILEGIETIELPETGVCVFWNQTLKGGRSRSIFLLEKSGPYAQMYAMKIVAEDLPKVRKSFSEKSIPIPGGAGRAGWRMLCKQMELLPSKGQAI